MKRTIQQGFTLIELLVVITIIALLASLAMPVYSTVQQKGNITKGISNCRQIIMALKVYASDNSGAYPDSASATGGGTGTITIANDAFRQLFIGGILSDERIFGCPASPYVPDGNIGTSPTYTQAVAAGENHWMMTGGLNDSSPASYPVVFENATAPAWDPTWTVTAIAIAKPGRVWSGPSIIIGLNDGSVSKMKLTVAGQVAPTASTATTDQFTMNTQGGATPPTVLGVSAGGTGGT